MHLPKTMYLMLVFISIIPFYCFSFDQSSAQHNINIPRSSFSKVEVGYQARNFTWGGLYYEYAKETINDSSGNVYVGGIKSTNITGALYYDITVSKIRKIDGFSQWNATWGKNDSETFTQMVIDSDGSIYVVGDYLANYSTNDFDVFLIKFDTLGSLVWNRTWGGNHSEYSKSLAIDSESNLYISLTSNSLLNSTVIVKYNSTGSEQWNFSTNKFYYSSQHNLYVDSADNLFITGSYSYGTQVASLWKMNRSGDIIWSKNFSSQGGLEGYQILPNSRHNLWLCCKGYYLSMYRIVVIECDSNGWVIQQKNTTYSGSSLITNFAIDTNDNIYILFQNNTYSNIIKYDSNLQKIWNSSWGSSDRQLYNLYIDTENTIYTTGNTMMHGNRYDPDYFLGLYYNGYTPDAPILRITSESPNRDGFIDLEWTGLEMDFVLYVSHYNISCEANLSKVQYWLSFRTTGQNKYTLQHRQNDNIYIVLRALNASGGSELSNCVYQEIFLQSTITTLVVFFLIFIFVIGAVFYSKIRAKYVLLQDRIRTMRSSPDFINFHYQAQQLQKNLQFFPKFMVKNLRSEIQTQEQNANLRISQLSDKLNECVRNVWNRFLNMQFGEELDKDLEAVIQETQSADIRKEWFKVHEKFSDFIQKVNTTEKHLKTNLILAKTLLDESYRELHDLFLLITSPFPFSIPHFHPTIDSKIDGTPLGDKLKTIQDTIRSMRDKLEQEYSQFIMELDQYDTAEKWQAGIDLIKKRIDAFRILNESNQIETLTNRILTFRIKQKLLDVSSRYPRIQISEFQEILNVPEINIIRAFNDMVAKNQLMGRFFNSSNTFAFDKTAVQAAGGEATIPQKVTEINTTVKLDEQITFENRNFKIISQLAQGGMGILFVVEDTATHEQFVLKQLLTQRYNMGLHGYNTCEEYWLREQTLIQRQSESPSPCMHLIGAVKNTASSTPEYYLILEFIRGKSLDKWILQFPNAPSLSDFRFILKEIILPLGHHLQFTHNLGIIHRDITPKNVMIVASPEHPEKIYPVLIDWGVAKEITKEEMYQVPKPFFTERRTMATGIHSVGNPPEEVGGFRPVAATDIYMFGSIVYFICSGGKFPPLPLTKEEYILDLAAVNPQAPQELTQLVRSMTQYEPADRIPTIDVVVQKLNDIIAKIDKNPMPATYFKPAEDQTDTYIQKKED